MSQRLWLPSADQQAMSREYVDSRVVARTLGTLLIIASLIGAASLLFPNAPGADPLVAWSMAGFAVTLGLVLVLGPFDHAPAWVFSVLMVLAAVLATVAVYGGGGPQSGAQFFYLWITPYAFAFFSLRQAVIQTAFVFCAYGAVLLIQVHEQPAVGSAGLLIGMWLIVIATVVSVGVLVRRLSRTLRDVDRRFHRAFADSPVGAAFIDPDLQWREVNDALCHMLERDRSSLVGRPVLEVTHPEDREIVESVHLALGASTSQFEARYVRPDGSILWAAVSSALIVPEAGTPSHFSQFRDITEAKRDREALEEQAIHDSLTGLYNRALFLDRLQTALANRAFHHLEVGVVILDLDHFKVVNDSLGHQAGDELLIAVTRRLQGALRPDDTLARLGGDEFVLLCEHLVSPMDILDRASALGSALFEPIELTNGPYVARASLGAAVSVDSASDAASLLRDADTAMYRAKARGRGRIELFDRRMRDEAIERLELENDLRFALSDDQLRLVYQPIVDIRTGELCSVEALMRWDHPTRGELLPELFIPLAEETGLITDFGRWALTEAVDQLATWRRFGVVGEDVRVSVNVSGRQLDSPSLVELVRDLLRTRPMPVGTLELELTESVLLSEHTRIDALTELRNLGVRVVLDDFGTGYSSLAYLVQFPIDGLKIDRSFVRGLRAERQPVLEAILMMVRSLALDVVVEGAETPDDLAMLGHLGCHQVQGYAIAPPLDPGAIEQFAMRPHHGAAGRLNDPAPPTSGS
jgi:diguanylate cyclase (GGDEF)-like protein/PAS domain S-box-containing protein